MALPVARGQPIRYLRVPVLVLDITAPENASYAGGGSGGGSTYTVQAGDSLSKIGTRLGVSWKEIFEANRDKLDDPDKIHPGQELTIPQSS